MGKIIQGADRRWIINELIGRGDAGEVLSVTAVKEDIKAVMKRPVQNATGGTIMRQAIQIENESRILARLDGLMIKTGDVTLLTPMLYDTGIKNSAQTSAYFMVSEQMQGKPLSAITEKALKDGTSISYLFLLSVISSLFVLLGEIHKRHVLWNDVKADHVYWDEAARSFAYIDWGNGLILDDGLSSKGTRLSAMDDYKQLIKEMGTLLSLFALDLQWDLDWPIDTVETVKESDIDLLSKRVKYAQEHLALRIIEKRGFLRHYLQGLAGIEGLQALLELVESLEQTGEKVESDGIIKVSQQLFLDLAHKQDLDGCREVIKLLSDKRGADLDFSWRLLGELVGEKLLPRFPFYLVSKLIFDKAWVDACWLMKENADQLSGKNRVIRLIKLIRQMALSSKEDPGLPKELLQELSDLIHVNMIRLRFAKAPAEKQEELAEIAKQIGKVIKTWEQKGKKEQFGSQLSVLREILPKLDAFKIQVPTRLTSLISGMLSSTRIIYKTWHDGELAACKRAIQQLYLWDPEFDNLSSLYQNIEELEQWLARLIEGPSNSVFMREFLSDQLSLQPDPDDVLGKPTWLNLIIGSLSDAMESGNLFNFKDLCKKRDLQMHWLDNLPDHF